MTDVMMYSVMYCMIDTLMCYAYASHLLTILALSFIFSLDEVVTAKTINHNPVLS